MTRPTRPTFPLDPTGDAVTIPRDVYDLLLDHPRLMRVVTIPGRGTAWDVAAVVDGGYTHRADAEDVAQFTTTQLQRNGVPLPDARPYDAPAAVGRYRLRTVPEQPEHTAWNCTTCHAPGTWWITPTPADLLDELHRHEHTTHPKETR